jgi:hypothetical protein
MPPAAIRRAVEADAPSLLALRQTLFAETDFLLWEPGEFKDTVEVERAGCSTEALRLLSFAGEGSRSVAEGFVVGEPSEVRTDRLLLRPCRPEDAGPIAGTSA